MRLVLAWIGLCSVCSAMTLVWWPFGLIPAVVVLALAYGLMVRRRSMPDVRARARTDWRMLAAWVLLVSGCTAGLYFGVSDRVERRVIRSGCYDTQPKTPGLQPSGRCERLVQLLACTLDPDLCSAAHERRVGELPPAERRRELRRELLRGLALSASPPASRPQRRPRRRRAGRSPASRRPPRTRVPRRPSSSAPPAPAGGGHPGGEGGPGQGGSPPPPAPPSRPSPSDTANRTKDRARDTANDATDTVGAGRPVPPLPNVPATPVLPDLVPCLSQVPPICGPLL